MIYKQLQEIVKKPFWDIPIKGMAGALLMVAPCLKKEEIQPGIGIKNHV
jgi:hypothetical protein